MRDFFVFTMITKTRPWRHIYHDIEIPRPKNHDIEIPRPKNMTSRFQDQKTTTSRFQDQKTTTSRSQGQKATASSSCGILTLMYQGAYGLEFHRNSMSWLFGLGILMWWIFGLGISMSWLFGPGILMSWYMCLHGLAFVIIVKTKNHA